MMMMGMMIYHNPSTHQVCCCYEWSQCLSSRRIPGSGWLARSCPSCSPDDDDDGSHDDGGGDDENDDDGGDDDDDGGGDDDGDDDARLVGPVEAAPGFIVILGGVRGGSVEYTRTVPALL